MAPELLRQEPYTEKAYLFPSLRLFIIYSSKYYYLYLKHNRDVFSYALVLWEMLTKQIPHTGMKSFEIRKTVGKDGLRPPIPPTCPKKYAKLIKDCWNQNPRRRLVGLPPPL